MVITASYWIENMIQVNIWSYWIMKQVMMKFGSLKMTDSGDEMISDAIYYSANFGRCVYR